MEKRYVIYDIVDCRRAGRAGSSAVPQNALDLADADPIDLGDLGCRHAVLHPRPDAPNCERGTPRGACGFGPDRVVAGTWCRTGAGGAMIGCNTRGLRAGCSAGGVSETDGALTGSFEVNSASAAWRALASCSRSSPRGCGWRRLNKTCS